MIARISLSEVEISECNMLYGLRTCSRFSTSRFKLLRYFSRLGVKQSRDGATGSLQLFYVARCVSRRICSTQALDHEEEDVNRKQNNQLKIPEPKEELPKFSQGSTNYEDKLNDNNSKMLETESFEEHPDTSDPCAGLDFNELKSEIVEVSKNINGFEEASTEDERFPLPSEPLDKGLCYKILGSLESYVCLIKRCIAR